jgi:hypothetical protein
MSIDVALDPYLDLIERHAQVALKKIKKPAEHTLEDLIQEGVVVFLYTKDEFEDRGASFKTILTKRLRGHLSTLVKRTYRNKVNFGMASRDELEEMFSDIDKKNTKKKDIVKKIVSISKKDVMDVFEIVKMSSTFNTFNRDEVAYIDAVLSFSHIPKKGRRKAARKLLGISYEKERRLRESIKDKINR